MNNKRILFLIDELGLKTEEQKELLLLNLRMVFRIGVEWANINKGKYYPTNKEIEDEF